ncbi:MULTISPECIES: PAS domain S-box protein [unclassified Leptolyngbya]|uniref:PAS domain S-box protein n=1 Tax=unclassified Leptolyngbya TaxID=2650499 RepID=UPI001F552B11|nr:MULTISPECIES: PAS domain S-box protein [unclassified Leptolyngbya]
MTDLPLLSVNTALIPANEPERLAALRRYNILDTPPEIAFDRITALAARLFNVPTALVSLVDGSRAWFKSCYGFNQQEVARDATICSFALLCDDVLVVPDARQDERFACNPFVQREPGLRFYAGAPLLTSDGFNLGTLCLLDSNPRDSFTDDQKATLKDLAAVVMDELELRLAARKVAQVDAALLEVTQGVSAVTGKAFFNALVRHLAKALGVNYACISLLTDEIIETVRTVAFCAKGEIVDNVEYSLQGTPCREVIRQQKIGCYIHSVQKLFPDDLFLVSLGIESYVSIPFFSSQGKLLGLLGVMDDKPLENSALVESMLALLATRIAAEVERHQAEEKQQEANQRLQLYADVVRNTQVGIAVWQLEDLDDPGSFRLVTANPAASDALGFDLEPMVGTTLAESFPTLLQTPSAQQYLDVIRTGRSLDLGEVSYSREGLPAELYSLKIFPLPDHCLGFAFENITAQKQLETQLQESQHYNQQIAEAMPGVLFVHDIINQENVYTNRQIADLLGYTSEQVQEMGANAIATLVHPDDLPHILAYSETFKTLTDSEVLGIEYRARHASREWRWLYTRSVVFNRTADGLPRQILGVSIDISDRKYSEQALQKSEAWARLATQVAQLGAWRLHLDTNQVEMDERMRQIWGEPDDAVMVPLPAVLERIHSAERDRVADAVNAAIASDSTGAYEIEYRIVWDDGTERWVLAKGQAQFEGEGAARHAIDFFGTLLDITERKQAEANLAEQEQRYRYIFEAVNVAIWEEDFSSVKVAIDQLKASGIQDFRQYFAEHPEFVQQMLHQVKILDVNHAALQMFGAQEKAELLSSLDQIVVAETQATFIDELLAIANEETFFATETVLQTLQGDRLNVWVSITFPPASEPYDHVLVSLLDITQRKQAEVALQASEERYRHLAEATPQIVWTTDARGLATYFNPYWYDYTGLSEAESMGLESINAMHPEDRDRVLQQWSVAIETGEEHSTEIRLRRQDGVYRWFLCRALPVRNANGEITSWVGTDTDIDDQKHIQEILRESEERLSLALQSAQAGMWQWFKADNCVIWSKETYRMLGYEPEQCLSTLEAWYQAMHPDDRSKMSQIIQQTLNENSNLYFEYRVCLPDGSVRWLADIGQITYDDQGNQEGLIGIQIDITQRKQSELERERSEAILNAFLTASPIALTLFDQNLRYIYANEALAQLNELPLGVHIGRTLQDVVPDMAPQFVPMLRRIIETQEPVLGLEYSGEIRPGVYRHTIANHFPVCLPDGEVLGVGVTITDITELKHIEAELRQHTQRLNLLYETARDLLSSKQPTELMNRLFARLSEQLDLHYYYHFQLTEQEGQEQLQLMHYAGISEEQAQFFGTLDLGQAMCGLVAQERRQIVLNQQEIASHGNAHVLCTMGVSAYAGQPLMVHGRLLGTLSFASLTRTQFTPEEANLLQAISEHVAIALERAELVTSLQKQTEDLAQANRVKDEFLAVLSHELRSPLNPILGWTKLLQTNNFDPIKTKQALSIIERNAKQQTQLIDDLLDISKILRGKLVLEEAVVDLRRTLEAALETMRLAAEAKHIPITINVEPNLPPVLGDAGRLQQIILNLLSNAIKFTPTGGQVDVSLKRIGEEAQLQVKDTGKGIVPEFLPHVFDSFRQEDGRTTRKFGGLGLGLAIVRQLTELHGGTVQADSQGEGTGATFTIRLPLMKIPNLGAAPPSAQAAVSQGKPLQGLRILVVDDEADMRDLAVTILEQAGAHVQTAASAMEALSLVEQFQPRVMVSDIGMPDIDGYELMRQLRRRSLHQSQPLAAIALTAYAMEQDQQQALAVGYQCHFAKPIEPEVLVEAIATLAAAQER